MIFLTNLFLATHSQEKKSLSTLPQNVNKCALMKFQKIIRTAIENNLKLKKGNKPLVKNSSIFFKQNFYSNSKPNNLTNLNSFFIA